MAKELIDKIAKRIQGFYGLRCWEDETPDGVERAIKTATYIFALIKEAGYHKVNGELPALSDKEILAAFGGDFKVDFYHKPTMEDIFLIKLRLVAKAQRDYDQRQMKGGENES